MSRGRLLGLFFTCSVEGPIMSRHLLPFLVLVLVGVLLLA